MQDDSTHFYLGGARTLSEEIGDALRRNKFTQNKASATSIDVF